MASAMVGGLLSSGKAGPGDLCCVGGAHDSARQLAARTGIKAASSLQELLEGADAMVLACKPQQLAGLDSSLAQLTQGRLVLSILAGKRLDRLERSFPKARNLVRAMPNTPGQIGAGVTGWCSLRELSASDLILVEEVLGAMGKVLRVQESQLDALTGLSGSGPAYVFEFAAALREAGVAAGLSREDSYLLAVETILGAARLMSQSKLEAEELRNQVTSPNGTTYAGLKRMEAHDFRGIIRETVLQAAARSVELSKEG
jgi:pyrroline-5-carboxylate reductase